MEQNIRVQFRSQLGYLNRLLPHKSVQNEINSYKLHKHLIKILNIKILQQLDCFIDGEIL